MRVWGWREGISKTLGKREPMKVRGLPQIPTHWVPWLERSGQGLAGPERETERQKPASVGGQGADKYETGKDARDRREMREGEPERETARKQVHMTH